jgi:hypothetical protein
MGASSCASSQRAAATPADTPPLPCPPPAALKAVLDFHNQVRATHGASPLTWNAQMAASAASYSQRCALQHSTSDERGGAGENLAKGHETFLKVRIARSTDMLRVHARRCCAPASLHALASAARALACTASDVAVLRLVAGG